MTLLSLGLVEMVLALLYAIMEEEKLGKLGGVARLFATSLFLMILAILISATAGEAPAAAFGFLAALGAVITGILTLAYSTENGPWFVLLAGIDLVLIVAVAIYSFRVLNGLVPPGHEDEQRPAVTDVCSRPGFCVA
jgi:hypothetical protein